MRDAVTRFFTPRGAKLDLGDIVQIGDEEAELLPDGMGMLVGHLGNVRNGRVVGRRGRTRFNPS
jgi:hypothetical protein